MAAVGGARLGLVIALALGLMICNSVPLVIGGLISESGFSAAMASALVTTELMAIAATSIALTARIDRLPLSTLAIAGCSAAAVFQIASGAFQPHHGLGLALYFGLRGGAGIGEGMLLSAANSALAREPSATRVYGVATIVGNLGSILLLAAIPRLQADWPPVAFLALAFLLLLPLPMLRRIGDDERAVAGPSPRPEIQWRRSALVGLFSLFLFSLALGALWAFSEIMGTQRGMRRELVESVLATNLAVGLGGGVLASAMDDRFGRRVPAIAGIGVLAIISLILGFGSSPVSFLIGQVIYGLAYPFALTFLMSTLASLDASGRLLAAAGGITLVGFALGPIAGSMLIATGVFSGLACAVSIALLLSAALLRAPRPLAAG